MFVEVRVEYDGPSLSDTSSLASREDESPEESQFSFSPAPGELSTPQLDDDAVTVSSKDTRHRSRQNCRDPSLFKKLLIGGARSQVAGSSSQNSLPRKPSRSRIFNFGSRASCTGEDPTGRNIQDNSNGPSSDNPASTERAYTNDPSAVFARLKLQEQLNGSLSHEHSLQTDRGQAWLQEQSNQTKAAFCVVPAPSTSDDAFSLNTSSPMSDGVPDMDILLQKDERGKYYYNYMGSGSSESAGDTEYEVQTNESQPNNDAGIPHELLIPEEVTGCDQCGCVLDQMRYICTTCGEKTPTSRAALEEAAAAAAAIGKGKSREFPSYVNHHHGPGTDYNSEEPAYPPRAHRVAITSRFSTSVNTPAYPSYKPLPALPSPTQTLLGRSIGSQTTLVPSSSSGSSSSTARTGYELCNMCFTRVGVDHSLVGGVGAPSSPTPPQTASELRRSAPKQNGQLRHAFAEQVWGFHGWQVIEQDEMSHHCSGCQSVLSGNRYKCGICDNFTICRACFSEVHNIHPIHPFLEMKVKPASRTRSRSEVSDGAISDDNVDEPSLKHPGVECFNCQQDIVGARFRCVDCTNINIDICSNCETAGLPGNLDASDGGHSSSHIMLKIPVPLNMHEVQNVSQRAHGLRHGRDRADLRGLSPLMRSSPGSISSLSANTVSYGNGAGTDIEDDYVHLQICNGCDEPIIGVRYQCLNCPSKPSSFNLCSDCEVKSYRVHDPMHTFLKIHRPVDIPGPLESEFPIIPILYRDPAGPPPGSPSANIPSDPGAYLRDLTHGFALCDRHMQRIVGKWYRCAFCAKDLCADCEVLDTHDGTHLFLVFKAPVDMHAFRHFADLENPAGSPPVLHGNIYYPRH
ncbi:hypothetical protein H4582DRAFT_987905 [Lactarius indigo]|nr:hypothetical protein H4582DRAFT_987905 [Lactarius indigo]